MALLGLAVALLLGASMLGVAQGQQLPPLWNYQSKGSLQLSDSNDTTAPPNTETLQLPYGTIDTWKLTPTDLDTAECMTPSAWLVLELYKVTWSQTGQPTLDDTPVNKLVFMASKAQAPEILGWDLSSSGQSLLFNPAENAGGQFQSSSDPGNSGTFTDEAASLYKRPYHRLLIPNVTFTDASGNMDNWFVRVANFDGSTSVKGYMIRASCSAPQTAPCPRADITIGPCNTVVNASAGGNCLKPVANDPRTFYCDCTPPWASYGCTAAAPLLDTTQTRAINQAATTWTYWTVQVPQNVPRQVLVVELRRDISSTGSAIPALIVKPTNTSDHNLPIFDDTNFDDMNTYGDVFSYMYFQDYHYLVIRDFSQGSKFYIGVQNAQRNNPNSNLVGTLKVSWGTPTQPFLCPADCNGRGTCQDPLMFGPNTEMGFVCNCNDGWGGLTCDGSVTSVVASTSTSTISDSVDPGQWKYIIMTLDDGFNPKNDDVYLNWQASDSNSLPSTSLGNAVLTITEAVYLKELVMSNPPLPYRELDVQYSSMAQQNRFVIPLQGKDLAVNQKYFIGLYNRDFSRRSTYSCNLDIYIPSSMSTWLHPYLSVVLGVTAAIILCLAMTMCKRLVIRRAGVADGQRILMEGTGVGPTMMQIMPRQRGVPQAVIDKFPTYTYVPPEELVVHKAVRPQISRTEREALQLSAAEAATAAAAAILAQKHEERASHNKGGGGGNGGGAVELAEMGHGEGHGEGHGVGGESSVASSSTAVSAVNISPAVDAAKSDPSHSSPSQPESDPVTLLSPTLSEADAMKAAAHQAAVAAHQTATISTSANALPAVSETDDVPACTVCLCEYEEGDSMRKLPCGHEFHRACIDKWMTQHTTCPICREPLVTPEQLQATQNTNGSGMAVILIPGSNDAGTSTEAGPRTWRQRLFTWAHNPPSPRQGNARQVRASGPWADNNMNGGGMMIAMAWGNAMADYGDPFASPLPMHSGRPRRNRAHSSSRSQRSPRGGGVVSEAVLSEPGASVALQQGQSQHEGTLPGAVEAVSNGQSLVPVPARSHAPASSDQAV